MALIRMCACTDQSELSLSYIVKQVFFPDVAHIVYIHSTNILENVIVHISAVTVQGFLST